MLNGLLMIVCNIYWKLVMWIKLSRLLRMLDGKRVRMVIAIRMAKSRVRLLR